MALIVSADFVPLPAQGCTSAALGTIAASRAGHIRVDVASPRRAAESHDSLGPRPAPALIDQGLHQCPCEIDLELSDVLARLAARGSYAFDFFVEPLEPRPLRLDVDLQRSVDGESWSAETVVMDCRPGTARVSNVDERVGEKLRLRMRFVADPPGAAVPVRVWLRNPGRG